MDFSAIDIDQITQRAGGAVAGIFAISMIDKQLASMNVTTKDASGKEIAQENPMFKYRHYVYAGVGAVLPYLVASKDKNSFFSKYEPAIRAFSDSMLFYGAAQVLENSLPQYVQIQGVGTNFASYVMGAGASTAFAMNNYVRGAGEQMMLIERSTGDQVFIDPATNMLVKPVIGDIPLPYGGVNASDVIKTGSPQDQFTMYCRAAA